METDTSTIVQIVSNVFEEMFDLPTELVASAEFEFKQPRVVASIRISGAVEELVVVEAPDATARMISETMFDADPGTLEPDEIQDAIGEVVNMIGGNIKGMYEGESQLSLPCVTQECDAAESGSHSGVQIFINVAGQPLFVSWHDMTPAEV